MMKDMEKKALNDDQLDQVSGGRRRPRSPYTMGGVLPNMVNDDYEIKSEANAAEGKVRYFPDF